jgi:flavin reductase (DIM6/NTAB) family NADH-FMN oxidoreductase RutF
MIDFSALFSLSYGLYVLSAKGADGKFYGCIANSAVQISAEPPSMAVSTNVGNLTTKAIVESGRFAISVLTQDADMPLIGRFGFRSSADFDKFEGVRLILTESGLPILGEKTCAYMECAVTGVHNAHTHKVIFGDLVEAKKLDSSAPPLTYGYYHTVIKGKTPKAAVSYVPE